MLLEHLLLCSYISLCAPSFFHLRTHVLLGENVSIEPWLTASLIDSLLCGIPTDDQPFHIWYGIYLFRIRHVYYNMFLCSVQNRPIDNLLYLRAYSLYLHQLAHWSRTYRTPANISKIALDTIFHIFPQISFTKHSLKSKNGWSALKNNLIFT